MNKKGYLSVYILTITFTFILIFIILFSGLMFFTNIYSVVYNYKIDLYNLNMKAIITANKNLGSYGIYNYNKEEYIKLFKEDLKNTYNLNDNLENGNKFITKIEILEYEIYKNGAKDSITNKKIEYDTIHMVSNINFNPIVFKFIFKDGCKFKVHNDIKIKLQ